MFLDLRMERSRVPRPTQAMQSNYLDSVDCRRRLAEDISPLVCMLSKLIPSDQFHAKHISHPDTHLGRSSPAKLHHP